MGIGCIISRRFLHRRKNLSRWFLLGMGFLGVGVSKVIALPVLDLIYSWRLNPRAGDLTLHPPTASFYGTSYPGGLGFGMVFRISTGGEVVPLAHFAGAGASNAGSVPSGLLLASDGHFYGTTQMGGTSNDGTVFKISPEGVLTTLAHFGIPANRPMGGLVEGADGNFYGTATAGSSFHGYDKGAVFRITPAGTLTILAGFPSSGSNGTGAFSGLTVGPDGNFYGTTINGGQGYGTIFRATPAGAITTLVEFTNNGASNKGSDPRGGLTLGADGNLYGTTYTGGINNLGTIFRVTPGGVLTTLLVFTGSGTGKNGSRPLGKLIPGPDGFLYGLTSEGGANNYGTAFRVNTAGQAGILTSFTAFQGNRPVNRLVTGPEGNLYGLAGGGGQFNFGTFYRLTPSGAVTTLLDLQNGGAGMDGGFPEGNPVAGPDGNLYGMTANGGTYGRGTVFRITPAGVRTTLVNFSGPTGPAKGGEPSGSLTPGADGAFFGMTAGGGPSNSGTIFRLDPAGVFTTLADLNRSGTNPLSAPCGSLTVGNDGNFYGMSNGPPGDGGIFRITPAGSLTKLLQFDESGGGNDGGHPYGSLTLGGDGNFYGIANRGGSAIQSYGTVFRVTSSGNLTTLVRFQNTGTVNPGSSPFGSLSTGPDGLLHGLTSRGGTHNRGTAFKMTTVGSLTTYHHFGAPPLAPVYGGVPKGSLTPGPDGNFYGMTSLSSPTGYGVVFQLTPGGILTNLAVLTGQGSGPSSLISPLYGHFVPGPGGHLYAMVPRGGPGGAGGMLRLSFPADLILTGNGVEIENADTQPGPSDYTDFGAVSDNAGESVRTYSLVNAGSGPLHLTGNPLVRVMGTHAREFTVSTPPPATIPAGASVSFDIKFKPLAPGLRSASIQFTSDSSALPAMTFAVQGTGLSGNADLASLQVIIGTILVPLHPPFNPAVKDYQVSLRSDWRSFKVMAMAQGGSQVSYPPLGVYDYSGPVQPLTMPITAQDGITTKTYTLGYRNRTAYDTWAESFPLPPAESWPMDDLDRDGRNNFLEWAFGGHPGNPDGGFASVGGAATVQPGNPALLAPVPPAVGYQVLFTRRIGHQTLGLTYTVRFSPDLSSWVDNTAALIPAGNDGTIEACTVPFPSAIAGKPVKFFQIRVTATQ